MRDPELHAKVLSHRTDAVMEALDDLDYSDLGSQRWARLVILSSKVWHEREVHRRKTGAAYPPRGQYYKIVPATEEEA